MQDRVDEATAGEPPLGWVLVTIAGGDLRAVPLTAGVDCLIGRELDCDLTLDHHRVSRRHARVRIAEGGDALAIEDLGTRSGTRVGGPIAPNQPRTVAAGEAITIGPFTLIGLRAAGFEPPVTLVVEEPLAAADSPSLIGVARGLASVLIRGEAGAGERALAELLHRISERAGELVAIECAAVSAAELARALMHARAGTVLLAGLDAAPVTLQEELARAVARCEAAQGAGADAPRFISTTRRDLAELVRAGALRLDLYYRLAGVTLSIPPPPRERRAAGSDAGLAEAAAADSEERARILDALERCQGDQGRAAKLLGISRSVLATRLALYRRPHVRPRR